MNEDMRDWSAGFRLVGESAPQSPAVLGGYICPLTGEELPCPNCCPLNRNEAGDRLARAER